MSSIHAIMYSIYWCIRWQLKSQQASRWCVCKPLIYLLTPIPQWWSGLPVLRLLNFVSDPVEEIPSPAQNLSLLSPAPRSQYSVAVDESHPQTPSSSALCTSARAGYISTGIPTSPVCLARWPHMVNAHHKVHKDSQNMRLHPKRPTKALHYIGFKKVLPCFTPPLSPSLFSLSQLPHHQLIFIRDALLRCHGFLLLSIYCLRDHRGTSGWWFLVRDRTSTLFGQNQL